MIGLRKFIQRACLKAAALFEASPLIGIYSSYEQVPSQGAGFQSTGWIAESEATLARLRQYDQASTLVPKEVLSEHLLLPLLVSVLAQTQKTVRILDVGGGFGIHYEQVKRCVTDQEKVEYHILEQAGVGERASQSWPNHPRIFFHSTVPLGVLGWDILYFCSSLQYMKDYRSELASLIHSTHAAYVFFVKFSGGDIPTYATAQHNLEGSVLPYWFINVREIVDHMEKEGYRLLYKSTLEKSYNQLNFPPSHRMGNACNLLFAKS